MKTENGYVLGYLEERGVEEVETVHTVHPTRRQPSHPHTDKLNVLLLLW